MQICNCYEYFHGTVYRWVMTILLSSSTLTIIIMMCTRTISRESSTCVMIWHIFYWNTHREAIKCCVVFNETKMSLLWAIIQKALIFTSDKTSLFAFDFDLILLTGGIWCYSFNVKEGYSLMWTIRGKIIKNVLCIMLPLTWNRHTCLCHIFYKSGKSIF